MAVQKNAHSTKSLLPTSVRLVTVATLSVLARGQEEAFRIDQDAYNAWIGKGAQPSDRVAQLVKASNKA